VSESRTKGQTEQTHVTSMKETFGTNFAEEELIVFTIIARKTEPGVDVHTHTQHTVSPRM
jgi:hypothetical protein